VSETARNLKLTLAYDGTAYAGWQVQPESRTLQSTLEDAMEQVTGKRIRTTASGRTDAGVHALAQVVSCVTDCQLSTEILRRALNANLPQDIVVLEVAEEREGFHAIRNAVAKRYRYVIHDGPLRDVFTLRYAWHFSQHLDEVAMHGGAVRLKGTHDFASFESSGSERLTTVRTVNDIRVGRQKNDLQKVVLEIEADGFLYNMVRAIVGSLVEIGRGRRSLLWIDEVLAANSRKAAAATAPPQGLFLVNVIYDN